MKVTKVEMLRLRRRLAQLPFRQADDRRRASSAGASSTRASARPASARSSSGSPPRVVGQAVGEHERIYAELYCVTRPAAGGVVAEALGAIENALLDAKAKALGVPCYELLGGKIRDRIRVYWSHCATWRINHPTYYKPAITDLDGVKAIGREVREKRLHRAEDQHLHLRRTASRAAGGRASACRSSRSSTSTGTCCATCASISKRIRDGAGPDIDLLLDLNFNAKTEGYLKILRAIADLDMFWVEIDSYNPEALGYIRRAQPAPDQLVRDAARPARVPALFPRAGDGCRDHRRGVERRVAVDEDRARRRGARGQRRAAQFLRPPVHDDERAFRGRGAEPAHHGDRRRPAAVGRRAVHHRARIRERPSVVPDRPGWGCEPNEDAIRAHPPKVGDAGLLNYGQKK